MDKKILKWLAFALFGTPTATLALSWGLAFAPNYQWGVAWQSVQCRSTFLLFCLANPFLKIGYGFVCLVVESTRRRSERRELREKRTELARVKQALAETESQKRNLREEVNESQETSRILTERVFFLQKTIEESWMKWAMNRLGIGRCERITLFYIKDSSLHAFANFSFDPIWNEMRTRTCCIGSCIPSQAARQRVLIDLKCPCHLDDKAAYSSYLMEIYGYSEEEIEKIRMKSCRFVSLAITDRDVTIGVILFESTSPHSFTQDVADRITHYCSEQQSYLCGFVNERLDYEKAEEQRSVDEHMARSYQLTGQFAEGG